MSPRVSVVVPVFNGLPYLRDLAQSLLDQTYLDTELIFSDGGSSDASVDFLNSISDSRVHVILQPTGTSAAGNWTAATMAAKGEFTKLICQDDLLYPNAIAEQVSDLQQHPEAVMATATRDIIDAHGRVRYRNRGLAGIDTAVSVIPGPQALRACYLAGTNVIGEPLAVLFRTNILQRHMPWQDTNPLMLDLSMYEQMAPHGAIVLRRNSVGAFRVSGASWSTRLARAQSEQTKHWQDGYEASAAPPIQPRERKRAQWGRRRQILTRRIAYRVLGLQGALTVPDRGSSR